MILCYSESNTAETDHSVVDSAGKSCGKVRQRQGKYGLGLLRLANVMGKGEGELIIRDSDKNETGRATTHSPQWWPADCCELLNQVQSKS